ncbi:MAG: hypothetical protein ACE5E1_06635 [Phycisphaerae bacterium]
MTTLALVLVGCDAFDFSPPEDMTVVVGGITDTRPYYGRVRQADTCDRDLGDFLLASCGCGEWRALVSMDDGSPDASLVVRFYSDGDYRPTGQVVVHGEDEARALRGTVDQDAGRAEGRLRLGAGRMQFTANRGEQHTDSAAACVLCHVGDDPVWPLPETHTPDFQVDPPNCLACHSVN